MQKINTNFIMNANFDKSNQMEPRTNVETTEMKKEVRNIMAHPENYKQYDSAEEMMKDILSDADRDVDDNM